MDVGEKRTGLVSLGLLASKGERGRRAISLVHPSSARKNMSRGLQWELNSLSTARANHEKDPFPFHVFD